MHPSNSRSNDPSDPPTNRQDAERIENRPDGPSVHPTDHPTDSRPDDPAEDPPCERSGDLTPEEVELLVACDEAAALGADLDVDPDALPSDEVERLARDYSCIRLLHRVWPDVEAEDEVADGSLPGRILGDFRVLHELGSGGMGVVYEAEQLSLRRHVALKIMRFSAILDKRNLQRFKNEALAVAALDHPNIVSVHSVGEAGGVHYLAMQLVRGQTLAELIARLRRERRSADLVGAVDRAESCGRSEPRSGTADHPEHDTQPIDQARVATVVESPSAAEYFRSVARLGVQAADALQHAHDQGVLHRDVKPGNLMLDSEGQLYVTDFGLARLEADASLTMTGEVLGTLRYMPPEQALSQRVVVDERADVYSLGATLYELLTLTPAFDSKDRTELLRQIAFDEPRPPRKIDRRIPAELETIVLKAMAKNRDDRYGSAHELAEDLQRFLDHRPVLARPPGMFKRASKWARRRPAAAALVALSLLAVAALWTGTLWHVRTLSAALGESEKNRQQAEASRRQAEASTRQVLEREQSLKESQYAFHMRMASECIRRSNVENALRFLSPYEEQPLQSRPRGFEWYFLWNLCTQSHLATLEGHTRQINMLGYTPDDKLLISTSDDGTVKIWDAASYKLAGTLSGHTSCVNEFALTPDGRSILTASCDGTVKIWDMATYRELETISGFDGPVWTVALSPDGRTMVTGSGGNADTGMEYRGETLIFWDFPSRTPRHRPSADYLHANSAVFSPDGNVVATAGGSVRLWDVESGQQLFEGGHQRAETVRYSHDGSLLISAGMRPSYIMLWNPNTRERLRVLGSANYISSIAISDDNALLAIGTHGSSIELWDLTTQTRRSFLNGHGEPVQAVTFSHDGRRVVSGGRKGTIKVWDPAPGSGLRCHVEWPSRAVFAVAFDEDLERAAVREPDGAVRIVRLDNGQQEKLLGSVQEGLSMANDNCKVSFSQSGEHVVLTSLLGDVEVWNCTSEKKVATLRFAPYTFPFDLYFSENDCRLSAILANHRPTSALRVVEWETNTWTVCNEKALDTSEIHCAVFNPRERVYAVGSMEGISIHSLDTGELLGKLDEPTWKSVFHFSADGEFLLCGTDNGRATLWDWRRSRPIQQFIGHEGAVCGMAISPDGLTVATGDGLGMIRLWDPRSGQEMVALETKMAPAAELTFSADGQRLACWNLHTSENEGHSEVRVWSIER